MEKKQVQENPMTINLNEKTKWKQKIVEIKDSMF